jgi:hypothetical protein
LVRTLAIVGSLALVASCTTGPAYAPLASEQATPSYKKVLLTLGSGYGKPGSVTLRDTTSTAIYLRFFAAGDDLGICDFYVLPERVNGIQQELIPRWIEGATFYSGTTPLAPARFLYQRTPKANEYDAEATCIRTTVKYKSFNPDAPSASRARTRGARIRAGRSLPATPLSLAGARHG